MILNINPGISVGDFVFGDDINSILKIIDNFDHVPSFTVNFNEAEPDKIVINLVDLGFCLVFKAATQQFERFVLLDTSSSTNIRISGKMIAGVSANVSVSSITNCLGPTFPPSLHEIENKAHIKYPGVTIFFDSTNLPLSNSVNACLMWFEPLQPLTLPSVSFKFQDGVLSHNGVVIEMGTKTDYIVGILGDPSQVFRPPKQQYTAFNDVSGTHPCNMWLNYNEIGVDFGFKGDQLDKVVFHTNSPDDLLFGRYNRCFFSLQIGNAVLYPHTRPNLRKEPVEYEECVFDANIILGKRFFYNFDRVSVELTRGGNVRTIIIFKQGAK
ncbi:hypothetical protein PCE1_003563 [Barthelona sp. PCE]